MGEPFKGTVNIDINDSTPDWEPYALAGAHHKAVGANPERPQRHAS